MSFRDLLELCRVQLVPWRISPTKAVCYGPILHNGHSESVDQVAIFPLAGQLFAINGGPDILEGVVGSHHRLN